MAVVTRTQEGVLYVWVVWATADKSSVAILIAHIPWSVEYENIRENERDWNNVAATEP